MKALLRFTLLVLAALFVAAPLASAQDPVSTGVIVGIQPKEGTLTLRSDQTQNMITFFGVDKANIFTNDGQPSMIGSLQLGTRVTVNFATRENKMYVSKVILPAAMPAVKSFPVNAEPSNTSASIRANDNNITTSSDQHKAAGVERVRVER